MSAPIERIDNSATAALYMVGMLLERVEDDETREFERCLLTTIEALLQRIEELVSEASIA